MFNFCTLFDINYLTRGLVMYESLKMNSVEFHLYIFPFDDEAYNILTRMDLEFTTIISLKEFEDEELLRIKAGRTVGEYCWTCTPSIIKYCIENYNLDSCTYIDADLYFFSNPSVLINEMRDKSILITEHRYTKRYDQTKKSGVYCVQFMTFKNDKNGMRALNWWRDACNEWCYARYEDGKFGDQKYLDDWPSRFESVHVLKNLGGGVAPWNVQQYNLRSIDFSLIFYHFHDFKFISNDMVDLGSYELDKGNIGVLYIPYLHHLEVVAEQLNILFPQHCFNTVDNNGGSLTRRIIKNVARRVMGTYNVIYKKELLTGGG